MKIAKWGNSLAVRLPSELVKSMGLKEGDDIAIVSTSAKQIDFQRIRTREEALASLRSMRVKLPDDWKFDRDEANAR